MSLLIPLMCNPKSDAMTRPDNIFSRIKRGAKGVFRFYVDGFRSMTVGKSLWAIILFKLAIFFGVLKLFFFPDLLERDYDSDEDRAQHVRNELIDR